MANRVSSVLFLRSEGEMPLFYETQSAYLVSVLEFINYDSIM